MKGSYQVLLISRDRQWQEAVEKTFAGKGSVQTVIELHEALNVIGQQFARPVKYDLIILDTLVSSDLTSDVRAILSAGTGERIVVATAAPVWWRVRDTYEAGAMNYIVKSLEPNDLWSEFSRTIAKPRPMKS